MGVVFHSGGVFILLGWLGGRGNQYCPIGQRAGREGEREKKDRRPPGGKAGLAYFRSCFAQGNEIFLIFRSKSSNFVTRMSPKARNEPGRRIAGGCVRPIPFCRNI